MEKDQNESYDSDEIMREYQSTITYKDTETVATRSMNTTLQPVVKPNLIKEDYVPKSKKVKFQKRN